MDKQSKYGIQYKEIYRMISSINTNKIMYEEWKEDLFMSQMNIIKEIQNNVLHFKNIIDEKDNEFRKFKKKVQKDYFEQIEKFKEVIN